MINKITLKISGMHCSSCATIIENALKKERGIQSANINFVAQKLYLEFNTEEINLLKIQKIIENLGYKAKEETPEIEKEETRKSETVTKIRSLKKRLLLSFLFGLPVIYMAIPEMLGLAVPLPPKDYKILFEFILTTAVVFSSSEIWKLGFKNLARFSPDMDSLIFLGTATAYFYSIIASSITLVGESTSYLYYETTVLILVFINLGKYLEELTVGKTSTAVRKLMDLQPKEATILRGAKERKIAASKIKVGDIVLVKPGEKIAVDGIIIDGYSAVDEKTITGESVPVEKKKGDQVIGGTINKTGLLKFKATRVGEETMLAQIIKIVEEAISSKPPIQILADKVSLYFVPSVLAIALLAFASWLFLGQSFSFALATLVAVLIIACPCAIGLATPTAVMMGTGLAAEFGILIKSGKAFETASKVEIILFDKTGTLTKGEPSVTDIIKIKEGVTENDILRLAGSIEKNSEHPLAEAIVKKAEERKNKFLKIKNFKALAGRGVVGELEVEELIKIASFSSISSSKPKKILLGTRKLMSENNININEIEEKMSALENQGKTTMILALEREILGIIATADTLKDYSKEAVKMLHSLGKEVMILTGDNKRVAETIAKELAITRVISEVLPQEKSAEVKRLKDLGNVVAFVGDGINDAPALAQADLGIALSSGTDIAVETGEIILIKDDLRDVATAIDISRYTFKKMKENLFWALFYNSISIPIAAGLLYPLTGWLLNPALASLAMALSSISVVFNALLMRRYEAKFAKSS